MEKIILNPQSLEKYCLLARPAKVTISNSRILFNESAVEKLALKVGSNYQLIIDDGKLYFKDVLDGEGFTIHKTGLHGSLTTNTKRGGVIEALYLEKIIKEKKATSFEFGKFKYGSWELIPLKTRGNNVG